MITFQNYFNFIKTKLCHKPIEINFQQLPKNPTFKIYDQFNKFTPAKKQKIKSLCIKLLATEQASIRHAAQLFGIFSSSFIVVP